MTFYSAFQWNAFQNNAFQIVTGDYVIDVLQGPPIDHHLERQNERYRQAKRDVERRQQAIIEQKLAMQEMLLRKRELEKERSRQSNRQIKALESEIEAASLEIEQLLSLLSFAEAVLQERKKNLAIVLLMDADPFFNIGGMTIIMH